MDISHIIKFSTELTVNLKIRSKAALRSRIGDSLGKR